MHWNHIVGAKRHNKSKKLNLKFQSFDAIIITAEQIAVKKGSSIQ